MRIDQAVNLDDLRLLAKRRLPRIAFDFIEGGTEDESCIDRNVDAFARRHILPRYLVDVSQRDQSARLFGQTYASSFGIAPTGGVGLFRPGGDRMLAETAVEADIPFIMSGGGGLSIEQLAEAAPHHAWLQLYAARDAAITEDIVRRAEAAGIGVLVLTVDVPVSAKRERNIRNGFDKVIGNWWQAALGLPLPVLLEALRHPRWIIDYVRHGGMPPPEVWRPYAPAGAPTDALIRFTGGQMSNPGQTWADLERIRKLFSGRLVIKGVLHPDDAIRAADLGCDGIIVSNHGARQLDHARASLDALPGIVAAVGNRLTVMLDSGVRRGIDVLIARSLGAQFVFVGRPMLYGVTAGGRAGVRRAIDILKSEIDLAMGQAGCATLDVPPRTHRCIVAAMTSK